MRINNIIFIIGALAFVGCTAKKDISDKVNSYKQEGYSVQKNENSSLYLLSKQIQPVHNSLLKIIVFGKSNDNTLFESNGEYHSVSWNSRYELKMVKYKGINEVDKSSTNPGEDTNMIVYIYNIKSKQLQQLNTSIP